VRYRIIAMPRVGRDLRRLAPSTKRRIEDALEEMRANPRAKAVKLAHAEGYRRRVGDYRIIFLIDDRARRVLIARVKHRRDAYRR
jgi:mRNA interferase RelE/StbE